MTTLVTGAAGFIGAFLAARLARSGETVIGVDTFNAYYDVRLKRARADQLLRSAGVQVVTLDVADEGAFADLVRTSGARRVVHLAAQAGVRYSLEAPFAYEHANLRGHLSVLEACRHAGRPVALVYASSSSVYGERALDGPFSETDPVDAPASLYAATKRSCELMSGAYARLFGLGSTGLRFFTVYGPFGRPDMAYYSFTRKILAGKPIEVFGEGRMARDFTYVDDIVDGVVGVLAAPAAEGEARILNIGDSRPVPLMRMIELLEAALGRTATKVFLPMQKGDVSATFADISRLTALTGYTPKVPLEEGLPRFVTWYRDYHAAAS